MRSIRTGQLVDVSKGFIGAIYSDAFLTASAAARREVHAVWFRIVSALTSYTGQESALPAPTTKLFWSWELCDCVRFFHTLSIDKSQLREFDVWQTSNVRGENRRLRLDTLRETFGDEFTAAFYEVADTYFSGRAVDSVEHINHVANFLASYPNINPERLHDNDFSITLWAEFLDYYIESRIQTARIDTIAVSWRTEVRTFLFRHLFQSGLASKPTTFIDLPTRKVEGHPKHIVEDSTGLLYTEKLLTAIPLQLTDREAIEVLFGKIQRAVDAILVWAEDERKRTLEAFRNRRRWALTGDASSAKTNSSLTVARKNPAHLENASATIAYLGGYTTRNDWPRLPLMLPHGLRQLARELGFPAPQVLLPFATILVHEHPEITPAMLEQLELYDEHGRMSYFFEDDEGWVLRCIKMRRGPVLAEVHIRLNERSLSVVREVISLTAAPRKYLKVRKDDDWRYLFITTGVAFGVPMRLKNISSYTSARRQVELLEENFSEICGLPADETEDLARCFSLPALRASIGVLEYIKTCSGERMAAKLGHRTYDATLLAHYLPNAIRNFLRVRYVRIMQAGIIVEAMKGSPYQLEASGFASAEELVAFLNAHTLRYVRNEPPEGGLIDGKVIDEEHENDFTHIVFNISVDVLTIFTSISAAMSSPHNPPTALAVFWNNIGTRLIAYIEEKRAAEPEHGKMLDRARAQTNPELVSHIVYGET